MKENRTHEAEQDKSEGSRDGRGGGARHMRDCVSGRTPEDTAYHFDGQGENVMEDLSLACLMRGRSHEFPVPLF